MKKFLNICSFLLFISSSIAMGMIKGPLYLQNWNDDIKGKTVNFSTGNTKEDQSKRINFLYAKCFNGGEEYKSGILNEKIIRTYVVDKVETVIENVFPDQRYTLKRTESFGIPWKNYELIFTKRTFQTRIDNYEQSETYTPQAKCCFWGTGFTGLAALAYWWKNK